MRGGLTNKGRAERELVFNAERNLKIALDNENRQNKM